MRLSPAFQGSEAAIMLRPSDAFFVNAISSGDALMSVAKRWRVSSTVASSSCLSHSPVECSSRYRCTAAFTRVDSNPRTETFM